jgi:glycosyltransferase involved in cell wall biosynthesis
VQCKYPKNQNELNILLERWNNYGVKLHQLTDTDYITIISPFGIPKCEKEFSNLRFLVSSKSFLTNLKAVHTEIKARRITATLVSGDLQFSLLFCILISVLLGSCVKIQTQFHGDVYSLKANHAFKGILRIIGSRAAVKCSDSIRIVSKFQEIELKKHFKEIRADFVVSPIPIDFSKIASPREFAQYYDVAFVGRLHYERGIPEAISILKKLIAEMPKLRVVIVGQGPEEGDIRKSLQEEISMGAIELFGAAKPFELRRIYGSSQILLSTAPKEGYGLTLREAVLSGVHVVARNNLGTREAAVNFPGAFSLFNDLDEAVTAVKTCLIQNVKLNDVSNFIREQQERERIGLENLVKFWVRN